MLAYSVVKLLEINVAPVWLQYLFPLLKRWPSAGSRSHDHKWLSRFITVMESWDNKCIVAIQTTDCFLRIYYYLHMFKIWVTIKKNNITFWLLARLMMYFGGKKKRFSTVKKETPERMACLSLIFICLSWKGGWKKNKKFIAGNLPDVQTTKLFTYLAALWNM